MEKLDEIDLDVLDTALKMFALPDQSFIEYCPEDVNQSKAKLMRLGLLDIEMFTTPDEVCRIRLVATDKARSNYKQRKDIEFVS